MTEEQLQRSVVELLDLYVGRGLLAFAHVPNGGKRSRAEAGIFRALGVRAGVPDLLLWTMGGGSFGIELKSDTGRLSGTQIVWHNTLRSLGHRVYVCRTVDDVEQALRVEGVPRILSLVEPA